MTTHNDAFLAGAPPLATIEVRSPIYDPKFAGRSTLSIEEAGMEVLGLSRDAAYKAAKTGDLPTIRVGRRLLVPKAALEKLLASA
jgi:excisionase family DNA binding protein